MIFPLQNGATGSATGLSVGDTYFEGNHELTKTCL